MNKQNIPLNFSEKNNSRISLALSIVTLLVLVVILAAADNSFEKKLQKAEADSLLEEKQKEYEQALEDSVVTATLLAAGDNYYGNTMVNSGRKDSGSWDYNKIYSQIKDKISSADLSIVQQPYIFTADHDMVSVSDSYALPTEIGDALVQTGFDVVASAGSHSDDFGAEYINQTLDFWHNNHADISVLGLHGSQSDADNIQVRDVNGIQIAFLNYAFGSFSGTLTDENAFMVDYLQKEKVAEDVKKAKEQSDCIIVLVQWGTEGNAVPDEYQKQWTNYLLGLGVKVLIGSHPGVLQPYTLLNDNQGNEMLVYYSLGNFVTNSDYAPELLGGLAEFTLEKPGLDSNTKVKIVSQTLTPLVMHYESDEGLYQVMQLAAYTDELAARHTASGQSGEPLSAAAFQKLYDYIVDLPVSATDAVNLLDGTYQPDGSMQMADASSITADELAVQYPADEAGVLNSLYTAMNQASPSDLTDEGTDSDSDSNYDSGYDSDY